MGDLEKAFEKQFPGESMMHQVRTYRSIVHSTRVESAFIGLRSRGASYEEALMLLSDALGVSRSTIVRSLRNATDVIALVNTYMEDEEEPLAFPHDRVEEAFTSIRGGRKKKAL